MLRYFNRSIVDHWNTLIQRPYHRWRRTQAVSGNITHGTWTIAAVALSVLSAGAFAIPGSPVRHWAHQTINSITCISSIGSQQCVQQAAGMVPPAPPIMALTGESNLGVNGFDAFVYLLWDSVDSSVYALSLGSNCVQNIEIPTAAETNICEPDVYPSGASISAAFNAENNEMEINGTHYALNSAYNTLTTNVFSMATTSATEISSAETQGDEWPELFTNSVNPSPYFYVTYGITNYPVLSFLSNPSVNTTLSTIGGESFDPNNGDLYVWANHTVSNASPTITVLNASTLKTITTITDPYGFPTDVGFDSADNTAYVAQTNDEITLINSKTNTIDGHLVLPSTFANNWTEAVTANPATHSVYLVNCLQNTCNLLVLNDATNQLSQTLPILNSGYPGGQMLLDPRTNAIYISGASSTTSNGTNVGVVDVFTPTSS